MEDTASTSNDKFIQVKMLILFVMSRLSLPVTQEELSELVMCDERISYFDITDCIVKLVQSRHLQKNDDKYTLTDKGLKSSQILEEDLPYSVRVKAEEAAANIKDTLARNSLLKTNITECDDGGCRLEMTLSDGVGEILAIRLITADKEQAAILDKHFRQKAPALYHEIIKLITS